MTLEDFLRETGNRRKNGKTGYVSFSEAERSFVLLYARRQMRKGISQSKICAQLCIGNSTLCTWLGSKKSKKGFKRVEVRSKATPIETRAKPTSNPLIDCGKVTIVSPKGFRLEGLTLDKAIVLLGELG